MSDSEILWTIAPQAPLFVGFFRQEYWSGLPFFSPGELPNLGIKPTSPVSPALPMDSLLLRHKVYLLPQFLLRKSLFLPFEE